MKDRDEAAREFTARMANMPGDGARIEFAEEPSPEGKREIEEKVRAYARSISSSAASATIVWPSSPVRRAAPDELYHLKHYPVDEFGFPVPGEPGPSQAELDLRAAKERLGAWLTEKPGRNWYSEPYDEYVANSGDKSTPEFSGMHMVHLFEAYTKGGEFGGGWQAIEQNEAAAILAALEKVNA